METQAEGAVSARSPTPAATGAGAGSGARSPGAILGAAREAQGLSIDDISRQLKLSAAQIKAIESDDHAKLPGPVFARGFIRSYARLLKLDEAQVLPPKLVPAPVAQPVSMPAPAPVKAPAAPVAKIATAAPVEAPYVPSIVAADVRLMQNMPREAIDPNPYRRVPAILAGIVALLLGLAYYEFIYNAPPPSTASPVAAPSGTGLAGQAMTSVMESSASGMPVETRIEAPIEPLKLKKSGDPVSDAAKGLHFVFSGESWTEVRDGDGQVIFSRTNAAGTERSVPGKPPFSVVVGGAANVKLSYNGKSIDLAAYAKEDVARLQVE